MAKHEVALAVQQGVQQEGHHDTVREGHLWPTTRQQNAEKMQKMFLLEIYKNRDVECGLVNAKGIAWELRKAPKRSSHVNPPSRMTTVLRGIP